MSDYHWNRLETKQNKFTKLLFKYHSRLFLMFFRCRCFSALVSSLVFNLLKRSRQRSFDISFQFSLSLKIVEMTWNNSECQKVIISYPIIKPQKVFFIYYQWKTQCSNKNFNVFNFKISSQKQSRCDSWETMLNQFTKK